MTTKRNQKYEFVYKEKIYEFDLRFAIPISDYIWENLETILPQRRLNLIDNEQNTSFSEESIKDFVSYLQKPSYDLISVQNILTFQKLDEKYKIQNLQAQIEEFIKANKLDLIILIILQNKRLDEEDIKTICDRLFYLIDIKHLHLLPLDYINRILAYFRKLYPSKEFEEEMKLMNFFIEYFDKNRDASILFQYINFQKVGRQCLSIIMENYSDAFDFKCIPIDVVKILCYSFANNFEENVKENFIEGVKEFKLKEGQEFRGIMRYLTEKTCGNIHDNGTIFIESKTMYSDPYHPKNLVDYNDESKIYHSQNTPGNEICFDFKDRSIQLTNYTIKSYCNDSNGGHLKDWVIEVSNDKTNWTVIDNHSNDYTLKGSSIVASFQIQQPKNEFYRYIKLRQTGYSWYSNSSYYYIFFPFIEFFGKLRESSSLLSTASFNSQTFNPISGQEFNGIMRYLTNQTGGSIHDNGTITITSSQVNGSNYPKNLVDYQNESTFFQSSGSTSDFVCFDFKNRSILLTHYSIKTLDSGSNKCGYLKNWVVEVSNNQSNWIIVDERSNDPTLNKPRFAAAFPVQQQRNEFYRYIRLRLTGDTWCTCKYMKMPFMEFFGKIKENGSGKIIEFNLSNRISCPYRNIEFDGIFKYIKSKVNSNISNEINITASSILDSNDQFSPLNVLQFESRNYFMTENNANSWICFDFKGRKIIPTHYTIRSYNNNRDQHPRSWVIEVSNNNANWEIIDQQNNCSYLNGKSKVFTFRIQKQNGREYKCIRLRQTGPNWLDKNQLLIDSFELYGELI